MESPKQEQPYAFTVREAARLLSVNPGRIYRMVRAGNIEAIHLGRMVRIPRPALERLCGIEQPASGPRVVRH